jgi:hypothetical protein
MLHGSWNGTFLVPLVLATNESTLMDEGFTSFILSTKENALSEEKLQILLEGFTKVISNGNQK